jgi:hypothetical protein
MRVSPAPAIRQVALLGVVWSAAGVVLAFAPQSGALLGAGLAFVAGLSALWSP